MIPEEVDIIKEVLAMKKRLCLTATAVLMMAIMGTGHEADGVEADGTSSCPCIEPAIPEQKLRNEHADNFIRLAELYRRCVMGCVDRQNNTIKEHRRTMTAELVKLKTFVDTCNDRDIDLFSPKNEGDKPPGSTNEGGRKVERVGSVVRKSGSD